MIYLEIYLAGVVAYCAWFGFTDSDIEDVAPIVAWPLFLAIALPLMAGWSLGFGVRFLYRRIRGLWAKEGR